MSYQNRTHSASENSDDHPIPADPALAVTIFTSKEASTCREERRTLRQLARLIRATDAAAKDDLPWIKLACFGRARSENNCLRNNANVLAITGIEGDYDAQIIGFDEAHETLLKAGIRALLYTSPGYTPETPRWRVLCPLSREYPPARREAFLGRVQGLFHGAFAPESFTLSQSYYYGSVKKNPAHRVEVLDGDAIDLRDDLDEIWMGKPGTKAACKPSGATRNGIASPHNGASPHGAAPRSGKLDEDAVLAAIREGKSYHQAALRLAGKWAREGMPYLDAWTRILAAFDGVPEAERDARWSNRKADLDRCFDDIYGKDRANGHAPGETDEAAVERLAKLPPLRYERVRQAEAERMGCRASILDALVRNARGDGADRGAGQGRPLDLPPPEPWPEPVDGAGLLDSLAAHFARHLVLPLGAADAMALWGVHAHCFSLFDFTPRLQFKATDPGSGKSTALTLMKGVVPKPLETETATSAALFRVIDLLQPTILLDEADTYLRDDEEMRGLVNAGVAPGGQALRCVGETQEPRAFACHAPLCLAGLGSLAPTIEDRAIRIPMVRRLPSEKIEPIEEADRQRADELLRKAARWTADNTEALRSARPDMGTLYNRAADRWRALYAIADLAGGEWGARARASTVALTPADDDAVSLGLRLLGDIRNVLADDGQAAPDWIRSGELVHRLVGLPGHPWAELGRARKPLTTNRLARMLRDYGIVPGLHGDERISGYTVNSFNDAFARNLS